MVNKKSNPFVGLRPYYSHESLLFFGRGSQTKELLERLHKHRFVAVIGSSGCGKSSLLRAGLIPALKAGYLVDDSNKWVISKIKPGDTPISNLVEGILSGLRENVTKKDISEMVTSIEEEGVVPLRNEIRDYCIKERANFFLLIDQFEELFRFSKLSSQNRVNDEAIDFVNIFLALVETSELPIYVVLTMRADFLGDCTQFYGLPEAINRSQFLVPRLHRQNMKSVIEGPVKLYGGKINPSLSSYLLNTIDKFEDELPLLQHALMRMWQVTSDSNDLTIDFKDYEKVGGIENALSNHAQEAIKNCTDKDIQIIKKIFQSLTEIDENGRKVRRPIRLKKLVELIEISEQETIKYLNLFIEENRSFLIINDVVNSNDKLIDISHESLIRQWELLNNWVDEETKSATICKNLSLATSFFNDNKRGYLTNRELNITLNWYEQFKPTTIWASRYDKNYDKSLSFLFNSKKHHEEAKITEELKKRKQRNLKIGLAIIIPILLVSIIYAFSIREKNQALDHYSEEVNEYSGKLSIEKEKLSDAKELAEQSLIDLNNYISSDLDSLSMQDSLIKQRILMRLNHYLPKYDNTNKQSELLQINQKEFEELSEAIKIGDKKYGFNLLKQLMPNAPSENIEKFIYGFNKSLTAKSINSPERFAAFMAVVASESEELTNFETKHYYNSKQLLEKFPDKFSDVEFIETYAGNPERIANRKNAGANGNGDEASKDGWKYRGRGIMKIRGKGRYEDYSKKTDYNLIEYPDLLSNIIVSTDMASYIWVVRLGGEEVANKFADSKDFESIANIVKSSKAGANDDTIPILMNYYKKGCNLFEVK